MTTDARSEPERRPERRIFGCRATALGEIAGFLALCVIADMTIGAGDRFVAIQPHPFWAIVLLTSCYYGTNEGVAAAILASLALLVGAIPEQGFDEDRSAWLLRISADPVLWILAAIVLGEICDGHRRLQDELRQHLRDRVSHLDALAGAYRAVSEAKVDLELRVAAQTRTVQALYRASRAVEKDTGGDVLLGAVELVRAVLDPRKFSVFLRNGTYLEAATCHGWTDEDAFAREYTDDTELFSRVIENREILFVGKPDDERALRQDGVLAAPLVAPGTDHVFGMLKIEEIAFKELTPDGLFNFQVACDWIGEAFHKALRRERHIREERRPAFRRELLPAALYERHRAALVAFLDKTGLAASVVLLRVDCPGLQPRETERLLRESLLRSAEATLARSDLIYENDGGGWPYTILMPNTDLALAQAAAQDLAAVLSEDLRARGLVAKPRYLAEPIGSHAPASLVSIA